MIRHPWLTVAAWAVMSGLVLWRAPDLTKLAAESFGQMLPDDVESMAAKDLVRRFWPDRSQDSVVAVVLRRPEKLTEADHRFAGALARRFEQAKTEMADEAGRSPGLERAPGGVVRVLGPDSEPDIAARLVSQDGTTQLVVAGLDADWVAPRADELVGRLERSVDGLKPPEGLEMTWSGDASLGRAYMGAVRTTLDRAVWVVVALLLVILLIVYRSIWLAMVPLATIGLSLAIARGLVAWLDVAGGVDPNPLVELFLVAVLFGSGTDLVLLVTWRFAEHWDGEADPVPVMEHTRRHEALAIITTGGTLALALSLLGLMRFRLFSQTGPAVAIGMCVGVVASLTLAPAVLVLLARHVPRAFAGFRDRKGGLWYAVGRKALSRPLLGWTLGVLALGLPALHALRVNATYDMVGELPPGTPALKGLGTITEKFGPGEVSPLTVVIQTKDDWRETKGLYLVDELSRQVDDHRNFGEVRSATQPLGSRDELKQARIGERLGAIRAGLGKIEDGAQLMAGSFTEEAAKVRLLLGMQRFTGLKIPGLDRMGGADPKPAPEPKPAEGQGGAAEAASAGVQKSQAEEMLQKLGQAASGARMIADGTALAAKELGAVVEDPVGTEALDRLLLTKENIAEHPEIQRSFDEYISRDGKMTRIEVGSTRRMHSPEALDQADELLERAQNFNDDHKEQYYRLTLTGPNIVMADVRRITNEDMKWAYVLMPLGIFLAMLLMLRDPGVCLNLVLTMLLTYGFTIGVTDWVFRLVNGGQGLDWKVKFFSFVLLMAVGVDYNIFLVTRIRQELREHGLRDAISHAIGHTGALITSAGAITVCSYLAFLVSPLHSLRELGFAVALGITVDALLVRTLIMPTGHYLLFHAYEAVGRREAREECEELHGGDDSGEAEVGPAEGPSGAPSTA